MFTQPVLALVFAATRLCQSFCASNNRLVRRASGAAIE
jgi:hypothetical protein